MPNSVDRSPLRIGIWELDVIDIHCIKFKLSVTIKTFLSYIDLIMLLSRYVPRGSVRVGLSLVDDERDLVLVGFERPDGGVAIVVLNR